MKWSVIFMKAVLELRLFNSTEFKHSQRSFQKPRVPVGLVESVIGLIYAGSVVSAAAGTSPLRGAGKGAKG